MHDGGNGSLRCMATIDDVAALVEQKVGEFAERAPEDCWGALAALWGRTFALGASGWATQPEPCKLVVEGLAAALVRTTGLHVSSDLRALGDAVDGVELQEVDEAQWGYMAAIIGMLVDALRGEDRLVCLRNALTMYLDDTWNSVAATTIVRRGESYTHAEDLVLVPRDDRWVRAVRFIEAL